MSTLQLTVNGGWTQFVKPLRDMLPFRTYGNLTGRPGPADSLGRLPSLLHASARRADYVVYSYGTPIAWHEPGMTHWLSPNVKYSVTTSKAQGRIFTALAWLDCFCEACTNGDHDDCADGGLSYVLYVCTCAKTRHDG